MMREGGSKTPEENRADSERLDRLFHGLWSHPCFTIAAVQGVALGGGAGGQLTPQAGVQADSLGGEGAGGGGARPSGRRGARA